MLYISEKSVQIIRVYVNSYKAKETGENKTAYRLQVFDDEAFGGGISQFGISEDCILRLKLEEKPNAQKYAGKEAKIRVAYREYRGNGFLVVEDIILEK